MSARVMVAGIGNVFLGDDGFGVEVAQRLSAETLPDGVTVTDVGIRALHLAFALLDRPDLLLIIDTASRGQPPGTLYVIEPTIDASRGNIADAHGMNLANVISALRGLGGEVPRILLVGCEPAFLGEAMGLSPTVEQAVPGAIAMVRRILERELNPPAPAARGGKELES
jgi:hydrogenase maturation protease